MTDIPHLTEAQRKALYMLPSNRAWLSVNDDVGLIVSFLYLCRAGFAEAQGYSYRLTPAGQAVKAALAKEQSP